jgi:hypothetical protein
MRRYAGSLFAVLFVVVIGCALQERTLPTRSEIDTFLAQNEVTPVDSTALDEGEYMVGMTRPVLLFMLGEPDEVTVVHEPWATQDHLYYGGQEEVWFILEDDDVVGILKD